MASRRLQDLNRVRAVFYARVSTEEEAQLNAIILQQEENRQEIAKKGWELVDEYVDEGKSGTQIKRRDEYQRLLEDMERDKFDVIVVKDQERLQRNTLDWYLFVNRLALNNIELYFYLDNRFYTPDDALITGIKAIMAEEYSRNLSKKLHNFNDRRLEKAKQGQEIILQGSGNAYGWDKKDGKYTINPEQFKIRRLMCELTLQGKGSTEIAKILNEAGYRNSVGNKWKSTDIPKFVYDEKNIGVLTLNKERRDFATKSRIKTSPEEWVRVEDALPPVVTLEEWDKLCKIRKERTTFTGGKKKGKKTGGYSFSGKLVCGICGKPYWRKNSKKENQDYYVCSTKQTEGRKTRARDAVGGKKGELNEAGCDNENISTQSLMEALGIVAERLQANPEVIKADMVKWLQELKKSILEASGAFTEADLKKERERKDKLLDSYLDGTISKEDYRRKASSIEDRIIEIQEDIQKNNGKLEDIAEIDRVLANIDNEIAKYIDNNNQLKVDFILEQLQEIVVYPDKIVVKIPVIGKEVIVEKIQFVSGSKRRREKHIN